MKAPEIQDAEVCGISWRDTPAGYQPPGLPLSEFLPSIRIVSPVLPASFPERQSLLVFMEESCLKKVYAQVSGDVLNEQAGKLLGQAYMNADRQYYVALDGALPADTVASSVQFRFHEDAWEKIWSAMPEKARKPPGTS